jgi:hypothetical protein
MPGYAVKRRHAKALCRLRGLSKVAKAAEARRRLEEWRAEARRRADHLDLPLVWDLTTDAYIVAVCHCLDPSGQLHADLESVCLDELARVIGPHVKGGSKPVAERIRLLARNKRPAAD